MDSSFRIVRSIYFHITLLFVLFPTLLGCSNHSPISNENTYEITINDNISHICASYQRAAIDVLVQKTLLAAEKYQVKSVGVVGGVAANSLLRRWMTEEIKKLQLGFYLPELEYCTDNAAMIARAGLERLRSGLTSAPDLNAYPSLKLDTSVP